MSPDAGASTRLFPSGVEHVVDAYGCSETALRSQLKLQQYFARIIDDLQLRVIEGPVWHTFPGPGGLTGLVMLAESHLSVHTFPERRYAAVNLYCCRQTADWGWQAVTRELLGASEVVVRTLVRGTPNQLEYRATKAAEL